MEFLDIFLLWEKLCRNNMENALISMIAHSMTIKATDEIDLRSSKISEVAPFVANR